MSGLGFAGGVAKGDCVGGLDEKPAPGVRQEMKVAAFTPMATDATSEDDTPSSVRERAPAAGSLGSRIVHDM